MSDQKLVLLSTQQALARIRTARNCSHKAAVRWVRQIAAQAKHPLTAPQVWAALERLHGNPDNLPGIVCTARQIWQETSPQSSGPAVLPVGPEVLSVVNRSRRKRNPVNPTCPVCAQPVHPRALDAHLRHEHNVNRPDERIEFLLSDPAFIALYLLAAQPGDPTITQEQVALFYAVAREAAWFADHPPTRPTASLLNRLQTRVSTIDREIRSGRLRLHHESKSETPEPERTPKPYSIRIVSGGLPGSGRRS